MLFRRVRCAFTTTARRPRVARRTTLRQVGRFYASGGHGHGDHGHGGHDHHALTIAERLPLTKQSTSSDEYIKEHLEYLTNGKSKPEQSWIKELLSTPAVLECFAEINTTEYSFEKGKLTATNLIEKYKEQRGKFETVTAPALKNAGVSPRIIQHLHELYKVRSLVSTWEVRDAISSTKFLGRSPTFRSTHADISPTPAWKILKLQPFNPNVLMDPTYSGFKVRDNEADQQHNVVNFRAVKAFIAAFERGFTEQELAHVKKVLLQASVPADMYSKVAAAVNEIKSLVKTDPSKVQTYIEQALNDFPENSPARQTFFTLLQQNTGTAIVPHSGASSIQPDSWTGATSDANGFKPAWDAAIENALKEETNSDNKALLEKLKQATDTMFSPELKDQWQVIQLLQSADLNDEQQEELLSIFVKDAPSDISDNLLLNVLNAHPIAAKLWGDRMFVRTFDEVEYTRHFHEGENTFYKPLAKSSEKVKKWVEEHKDLIAGAAISNVPFPTGIDEVVHMRLVRLAEEYYGFDLSTELGVARFDLFMHNYDVSPGEDTLDRVQSWPPAHHTYEELPIIKFEGYEESDEPEHHEFTGKHVDRPQKHH